MFHWECEGKFFLFSAWKDLIFSLIDFFPCWLICDRENYDFTLIMKKVFFLLLIRNFSGVKRSTRNFYIFWCTVCLSSVSVPTCSVLIRMGCRIGYNPTYTLYPDNNTKKEYSFELPNIREKDMLFHRISNLLTHS